jgi:hypothetical protein
MLSKDWWFCISYSSLAVKYVIPTYAECFEVINGDFVPSKMEERILKRAGMPVTEVG